jgi:hypothetical protein
MSKPNLNYQPSPASPTSSIHPTRAPTTPPLPSPFLPQRVRGTDERCTRIGRTCKVLRRGRGQVLDGLAGMPSLLPLAAMPSPPRTLGALPCSTTLLGQAWDSCLAALTVLPVLAPEELVHVFEGVGVCGVKAQRVFISLPHLCRERTASREPSAGTRRARVAADEAAWHAAWQAKPRTARKASKALRSVWG